MHRRYSPSSASGHAAMTVAMMRRSLLALIALLALVHPVLAQQIAGKVVGVSDGDTIKVLAAGNQPYKIRLHGVDAPETHQPFGSVAKQFTSKAVFGQQVKVEVKDTDKYGRTVGVVIGPNGNLNQSLVKNGYAWWYRQYAPEDTSLKQLEYEARVAKRGLWAEAKTAIAPWDWRQGKRPEKPRPAVAESGVGNGRSTAVAGGQGVRGKAKSPVPVTRTVYITRTGDRYHEDGCRHLRRSQIAISLKDAEAQGYSPCMHCH